MYYGRTPNVPEDIPSVVPKSFVQSDHSIGVLTEQRQSNSLAEKSVTKNPPKRKKEKAFSTSHHTNITTLTHTKHTNTNNLTRTS